MLIFVSMLGIYVHTRSTVCYLPTVYMAVIVQCTVTYLCIVEFITDSMLVCVESFVVAKVCRFQSVFFTSDFPKSVCIT